MNKSIKFLMIISLCVLGLGPLFAATDNATHDITITINEVVKVDLDDATVVNLTTITPVVGGDPVLGTTDATRYLQYTSLVASGTTRNVTAALDALPAFAVGALHIELTATPSGGANEGAGSGAVSLTTVAADIITGIGSCATGTALGADGANLSYELVIDDPTLLNVTDTDTVQVTLTLTDAS